MKYYIDPGNTRKSINFIDNIIYKKVKNLNGEDLELDLSIMSSSGNIEMKTAGFVDAKLSRKFPTIVWVSGGGFRGVDKNQMIAEMQFLADEGFIVVSVYYRSSAEGKMPTQVEDVKTAIRFLRKNADKYNIDSDRIGIMGRSAGGYLASFIAMNTDEYLGEEYLEYSSNVRAAYDMFGPVSLTKLFDLEAQNIKNIPNYRWKTIEESHSGAVVGGDLDTMRYRASAFDVDKKINEKMCNLLISHGDSDPLVPLSFSEEFYDEVCNKDLEDKVDLYVLKNGGHGSDEFFQKSVRDIVLSFFNKYLKY